jgi:hypothetical protein
MPKQLWTSISVTWPCCPDLHWPPAATTVLPFSRQASVDRPTTLLTAAAAPPLLLLMPLPAGAPTPSQTWWRPIGQPRRAQQPASLGWIERCQQRCAACAAFEAFAVAFSQACLARSEIVVSLPPSGCPTDVRLLPCSVRLHRCQTRSGCSQRGRRQRAQRRPLLRSSPAGPAPTAATTTPASGPTAAAAVPTTPCSSAHTSARCAGRNESIQPMLLWCQQHSWQLAAAAAFSAWRHLLPSINSMPVLCPPSCLAACLHLPACLPA